jgi:HSP20 family protein
MAIVRWSDPLRELAHLQDRIDRAFIGAHGLHQEGSPMASGAWVPPVDIYQNGDQELVLKAELPDMTREDIDVTIDKGTLAIKGEKKLASDVKEDRFHRIERSYGAFSRSFSLSPSVDATRISAEYSNGVLTVRLPLREDAKPRQIKVDVAA